MLIKKNNEQKRLHSGQQMIVIPVLILAFGSWAIWWLYPNFSSILLAFQDKNGAFTTFNFEQAWISLTSGTLGVSLKNTLIIFLMGIFIRIPAVTLIVYFIYKKIPGSGFWRIIFYLPAIIPSVTLTGVFKNFIATTGPLGKILSVLGITMQNEGLLAQEATAFPTVCFYLIWVCFCNGLLVTNGAMQRIPPEILESAKLEGCGPFRELFSIILPLVFPTITTLVTLACTGILGAGGGTVMLLSKSPTLNGTSTIHYWMFKQVYGNGMGSGDYGIVSAIGLCFTIVLIPFTMFVRKILGKVEAVEY